MANSNKSDAYLTQLITAFSRMYAAYCYMTRPWDRVIQCDLAITLIRAMLISKAGDDHMQIATIRKKYDAIREKWKVAVWKYDDANAWKVAYSGCSAILDEIIEEAVAHDFIRADSDFFDPSAFFPHMRDNKDHGSSGPGGSP